MADQPSDGTQPTQQPVNQPAAQQPQQPPKTPEPGGQASQQPATQPAPQKRPVQLSQTTQRLKEMMSRERKLQEKETALQQREREIQEAKDMARLAKEKPLEFLQKQGLSYSDLTKQVVNGGAPDPTEEIKQELNQLKSELMETKQQESQKQREAALNEARQAVRSTLENAEGYDLVKATESYDQVFQTIIQHYEQTGEVLSEDQAAKQVEDALSGTVDRLLQLDVVKKRLGAGSEEAPQANPTGMGTLDNAAAAQAPTQSSELDNLSEEESIAKLAEMLQKGQLPSPTG